jgi:hypothetical protein
MKKKNKRPIVLEAAIGIGWLGLAARAARTRSDK